VGLYFGGKFCLYYLDCDNHLYESHAAELKDACDIVTDFFSGQIALDKFDKHFLSIGSKSHFENGSFDHTINSFAFFGRLFFYFLLFSMLTCCAISIMIVESPLAAKLILLPFSSFMCLLLLYSVYLMVRYYVRSKNMYLNISYGNEVFQFGDNYDDVKNYNKRDISNINIYSRFSSKGTPLLDVMEVNFSDGSEIEFPGLLIDPFDLRSKFPDTKITRFDKPRDIRKRMWNFANRK
jgi:hypothetical protein